MPARPTMTTPNQKRPLQFVLFLLLCLTAGSGMAQRAVGVLRAPGIALREGIPVRSVAAGEAAPAAPLHRFTFERNLIFFHALVDGRPGDFILDTGAPSLIVNHRGQEGTAATALSGQGAGGEVALSQHHVERFELGGRTIKNYWAIGLDLRSMEARTERRIDGFVGYDLINTGELRIDYAGQSFQLLPSVRRPTLNGRPPRAEFRFELVDHLPVIRLQFGRRRYAFAVDTGAGTNLIDAHWLAAHPELATATGRSMNIQGLDGGTLTTKIVSMATPRSLRSAGGNATLDGVVMELDHLQRPGGTQLTGILGSGFLSGYTVGIDYRRRKLYLW